MAQSYKFDDVTCLNSEGQQINIDAGTWTVVLTGPLALIYVSGKVINLHRMTLDYLQMERKVTKQ